MATKSYKRTNNAVSTASMQQVNYTQGETTHKSVTENGRMSVDEYFDKVWAEVLKKSDNDS